MQVLRKQLDESTFCPLCQASMYFVETEQYEKEINFHECSHCQHQLYQDPQLNCHCKNCQNKRKQMIQATKVQEQRISKQKEVQSQELDQLSFLHQLFLLSLLDDTVQEGRHYQEYIDWSSIKYHPFTPHYYFQSTMIQQLLKANVLSETSDQFVQQQYYLHLRLDGYADPSLFSITQHLRQRFYENLTHGIPFKTADEVKNTLHLMLYQEIVQFMQHYCRTWGIQISGNLGFQSYCFGLLEHLAVGQIYYLIQKALEYLYQQKALQPRNDKFINTHLLKKTLTQYRERALAEKWETPTLPRPSNIPLSKMSEILFFKFLGYDERIFFQPIWRSWKKIAPRLNFYSDKRCMHCGSNKLKVDYDAGDYVSLTCLNCKHQDHYFTQ
ncbi:hypothetical protein EC844_12848 [Acinetobacter calcoaceticus]|uniref:Uncharacterized protein n=1 Tax=Acinetobacter calcoaceticus TaxID=471 RepID=A0A4R1XHG9_ACICA|nr:hypothetical protein EC844_12848 [Acinetobacter calcoaceticus]